MSVYLVEPTTSTEAVLTNLTAINTKSGRVVKKDVSLSTGEPLVFPDDPLPLEFQFETLQTSDLDTQRRKLAYMNMCGLDVLCVIPDREIALLGAVESGLGPETAERSSTVPFSVSFVGKGTVFGYAKEAENYTDKHANATVVADATASGGSVVRFDALGEWALCSYTAYPWALPAGDYKFYIRAKAGSGSDITMEVYNATHGDHVVSDVSKTLTTSWAWYSMDFNPDSGDVNDVIWFQVTKASSNSVTNDIDMFAIVKV